MIEHKASTANRQPAIGNRQSPIGNPRAGIALILVLGMLSVMLVLGVAFVVTMRTERVAAGNANEVTKARHLVFTALARAMQDIEKDLLDNDSEWYPLLWDTNYPGYINAVDLYTGDAPYLAPRPLLEQVGKLASPGDVEEGSGDTLRDEEADWKVDGITVFPNPWIERITGDGPTPGTVTGNGEQTLSTSGVGEWEAGNRYRLARPQWSRVEGVGKVAYLVLNLSGVLDANLAGGASRGAGGSAAELQLDRLPEFGGAGNVNSFVNDRTADGGYETEADLVRRNSVLHTNTLRSFWTWSRFATNANACADLSGSVADIKSRESEIKQALAWAVRANTTLPPTPLEVNIYARDLYANLVDYVDADNVPGSAISSGGTTAGPYVEAVPMINELFITNSIMNDGTGTLIGPSFIRVQVETFYPFVQPLNDTFTLNYTLRFTPMGTTPANLVPAGDVTRTYNLVTGPAAPYCVPAPYIFPQMTKSNAVGSAVSYTVEFRNVYVANSKGQEVDRIPDRSMVMVVPPGPPNAITAAFKGEDVIDPRLNWLPSHWADGTSVHAPYEPSIGAQNHDTTDFLAANTGAGSYCDGDTELYISDAGQFQSVGELANLYFPGVWMAFALNPGNPVPLATQVQPWRTLRCYDKGNGQWDRFFDYFRLGSTQADHGLVNVNTRDRYALASVFYGMKADKYPGGGGTACSWPAALSLADLLQARSLANAFQGVSEMGEAALANDLLNALGTAGGTELEKEALFRNAGGLLGTRQNLFAILLAAKTEIAAEQRAIAVVWRNPEPDANGFHASYLRWFAWLEK